MKAGGGGERQGSREININNLNYAKKALLIGRNENELQELINNVND